MKKDRLQVRVAKNLLAKVRVSLREFFAYVQDVAKSGVGFACSRELDMGAMLDINLNVPGKKTMLLKGEIVWTRSLPGIAKNKYQYGVRLTEKPDEYDEYVEECIRQVYEKRKDKRFKAALSINTKDVLDLLDAAMEDISAAGLYIRTGRPLTVNAQYEMALESKDLEQPINCIGEAVAIFECEPDDNFDHPYGAGIKIISFVGEDGERFSEFIKHLEGLFEFHWPKEKLESLETPDS